MILCTLVYIWDFPQVSYPYHIKSNYVGISEGEQYGELIKASSQGFKTLMEVCETSNLSRKRLQEVVTAQ